MADVHFFGGAEAQKMESNGVKRLHAFFKGPLFCGRVKRVVSITVITSSGHSVFALLLLLLLLSLL